MAHGARSARGGGDGGVVGLVVGAVLALAFVHAAIFREPARRIALDDSLALAPADGRVVFVGDATEPETGERRLKIAIFMSPFHVHSNRAPASGEVVLSRRVAGRFFNAALEKTSTDNERHIVAIETPRGRVTCAQVAGFVAAARVVLFARRRPRRARRALRLHPFWLARRHLFAARVRAARRRRTKKRAPESRRSRASPPLRKAADNGFAGFRNAAARGRLGARRALVALGDLPAAESFHHRRAGERFLFDHRIVRRPLAKRGACDFRGDDFGFAGRAHRAHDQNSKRFRRHLRFALGCRRVRRRPGAVVLFLGAVRARQNRLGGGARLLRLRRAAVGALFDSRRGFRQALFCRLAVAGGGGRGGRLGVDLRQNFESTPSLPWLFVVAAVACALGLTMVSELKYHSFKDLGARSRLSLRSAAALAVIFGVLYWLSEYLAEIALLLFGGYWISGCWLWAHAAVRRARRAR